MRKVEKIKAEMNRLGSRGIPFAFLIDFEAKHPQILKAGKTEENIFWQTPLFSNLPEPAELPSLKEWKTHPVSFETYKKGFDLVQHHIHNGDTYLLNYTQPTP
jgi:para-aminobenzoate synthetase component 1